MRVSDMGPLAVSAGLLLMIQGCAIRTKVDPENSAPFIPSHNRQVCLLAGAPPTDTKYFILGNVKATKRTYGSVEQLMPEMADEARMMGADAIINLQASQRFKGPLPWRVTAPTGIGAAIKFESDSPVFDCEKVGGKLY